MFIDYRYELAEDYADDDEDKEAIGVMRKRVLRKLKDQDDLVRVSYTPMHKNFPYLVNFSCSY